MYTENIWPFVNYYLQSLAKKSEKCFKDTNNFLKKLKILGILPKNEILCTIDFVR